MMKIFFTLFLLGSSLATQGQPDASLYCAGNVNSDNSKCSACYNYGLGTIGARVLSNQLCTAKVADTAAVNITDCQIFDNKITSTLDLAKSCLKCNSKKWMNFNEVANPDEITCSDTAVRGTDATNCGDQTIADCDQYFCNQTAADTASHGCRRCASTKTGSGTEVSNIGWSACAGQQITGCDISNPQVPTQCYSCLSGKVVNNANGCNNAITDTNCRKLDSTDTFCSECKDNYYFSGATCTLGYDASTATTGANLMAFSAAFMALAVFFN